jgi:hypothetical protein
MNKKAILLAALAGVALSVNALAYSPKDSTAPATPAPHVVPSSVVQPTNLPRSFAGAVINVEFSLDHAGQPRDIKVLWESDPVLKKQLVSAFRQWRFETAVNDPEVTTKRFILPIKLNPEV